MPTNGGETDVIEIYICKLVGIPTEYNQPNDFFSISLRPSFGPSRSTRFFCCVNRHSGVANGLCPSRPLSKTVCKPPIKIQWKNFRPSFRTRFAHSFRSPQAQRTQLASRNDIEHNKSRFHWTVVEHCWRRSVVIYFHHFSFCLSVLCKTAMSNWRNKLPCCDLNGCVLCVLFVCVHNSWSIAKVFRTTKCIICWNDYLQFKCFFRLHSPLTPDSIINVNIEEQTLCCLQLKCVQNSGVFYLAEHVRYQR